MKCSKCKKHKSKDKFSRNRNNKNGRNYHCKECVKEYDKTPEAHKRNNISQKKHRQQPGVREQQNRYNREYRQRPAIKAKRAIAAKNRYQLNPKVQEQSRHNTLRNKYGITLAQYNDALKAQNYSCKICGIHIKRLKQQSLYVDHNHKTGEVRGLLCSNCNRGLGYLEDVNWVQNANHYLRETIDLSKSEIIEIWARHRRA